MAEKKKIFLYLAKRDKTGIKAIATFTGDCPPVKIQNIKSLGLIPELEGKFENIIYEHRMLWEPWLEGALNYQTLKKTLRDRGYQNVPTHAAVKHIHVLPTTKNLSKTKTMLRKKH